MHNFFATWIRAFLDRGLPSGELVAVSCVIGQHMIKNSSLVKKRILKKQTNKSVLPIRALSKPALVFEQDLRRGASHGAVLFDAPCSPAVAK